MLSAETAEDRQNTVIQTFEYFRDDLDQYHDRRERLIKASRDITNIAKKTIFLLHRLILSSEGPLHQQDSRLQALHAAGQGGEKLREIRSLYAGLQEDLRGELFWRYEKQVSPGLQEYIEALSFVRYLENGSLISFKDVQSTLTDENGIPYFPLTVDDYLLGLSDLTGELMRFAISGIAKKSGRTKANEICAFVRQCKADFERMTPYIRELSKKQAVTSQSLQKLEDATYAIVVRESEYDLPPEMLNDIVTSSISAYGRETNGLSTRRRHRDVSSDDERNEYDD